MIAGLIICILLGGFISYFFLRKNYNPLHEIVSYFQNRLHADIKWESNEYGFIRQALGETLKQKEVISLKLEQQNKALRSSFIAALLKGRKTALPIDDMMASYHMSFKYRYFTVIAVYTVNMADDFWNMGNSMEYDKYDMSRFVVTNVLEEVVNRNASGYMTEIDDMLVCLVNMDHDKEEYKEALLGMIHEAGNFIEQNFRINLAFSIGSLHGSMSEIREAFENAVNAMEYSRIMGTDGVVCYEDIAKETEGYYYYPVEKEYQLINCIKSADYTAASDIIETIFQRNFINNTPSPDIARCLMFNLISTILKSIIEIDEGHEKGLFDRLNPVSELIKCEAYLEIKEKILHIVKDACEFVSASSMKTDCRIRDMVMDIIEKNYHDPNLSMASIAEKIGNHPNYVSKVYKLQTGESIPEYINRVRISKAKELLKQKALNQGEIAEKVGYSNIRTYQRAFKKYEGTSPGRLKIS